MAAKPKLSVKMKVNGKTESTMRRSSIYSILAILALTGCQTKELDDTPQRESNHFTATIEDGFNGAETKTFLDERGNVLWKQGDQISIFVGSTINEQYQVTDDSEGKTAASLNKVTDPGFVAGGEIDNNVAFYPYASTAEIAKSGSAYVISDVTLPATQSYAEASFGNGAFPMAAVTSNTDDMHLKFKNVLGGLKLQLKGTASIASIRITGNRDEILFGSAEVTVSNGSAPSINLTDASAKTVILDCGEGVQLNEQTAIPFVIALPPMTMEGGFTVVVTDTEGKQMEIKTTKTQTINRSNLLKMPVATFEGATIAGKALLPSSFLPSSIDRATITGVNFYVNSDKVTDIILNSESGYDPIYFEQKGTVVNYYTRGAFYELTSSASEMFANFNQLTELDLSVFDTQNVKWMHQMFQNCNSLKSLNLSSFNTENVSTMSGMFQSCTSLRQLDLSCFNTAKVESMGAMFERCFSLEYLDISSFDYSNCTYCGSLLSWCQNLMYLDLGNGELPLDGIDAMCQKYALGIPYCYIRCTNSSRDNLQQSNTQLDVTKVRWIGVNEEMPPYVSYKDPALYYSSDYSKDKKVSVVQTSSTGKGADLIFIGDAYSDRQIDDGTYDKDMDSAIEAVFSIEPMASYRSLFNIYIVYAVSETEVVGKNTALHTMEGDDGYLMSDAYVCNSYAALACPGTGIDGMGTTFNNATIMVVINSENGLGISYTTISANPGDYVSDYGQSCEAMAFIGKGTNETVFKETVLHEFGHAFAKLADEYYSIGEMDKDAVNYMRQYDSNTGYNKNVDYSNDPLTIKWHRFLSDSRYDGTVGIFEGGHAYYDKGVWRPTEDSIMKSITGEFNAPSREAIYYRIHKLAYGEDWVYDYETFVQQDLKNIKQSAPSPALLKRTSSAAKMNRKPFFKVEESFSEDGKKLITTIQN